MIKQEFDKSECVLRSKYFTRTKATTHMMEFVIIPVYQLGESQFVKHFPFRFDYMDIWSVFEVFFASFAH